jgi:predicted nucleotidyltransferase
MAEINNLILEIVRRYLKRLNECGIHVEKAYIFGSCSRSTDDRWSDIDLAVVSPEIEDDRFEERVRLMKLAVDIDSRIEPLPFRPDTFIDDDPLVREIKKEGFEIIPA